MNTNIKSLKCKDACGKEGCRKEGVAYMLDNGEQVALEETPCVQCRKCMPEEWLSANCPCIMYRIWERYIMEAKYK